MYFFKDTFAQMPRDLYLLNKSEQKWVRTFIKEKDLHKYVII